MATYEIRYVREKVSDAEAPILGNPRAVADYVRTWCFPEEESWRERSVAVFADTRNRCLGHIVVSVGGSSSTFFDPRIVCKGALDSFASKVILAHNHPSGDPKPSGSDMEATKRVKDVLSMLNLTLMDHIILGEGVYYSYADETVRPI